MNIKKYYEVEGYKASSEVGNAFVYGLDNAIKVSGYPMQTEINNTNISNKDISRAVKLANTKIGEGHDNFLNGVIVQFDLTFSNKAWVEFQRYHFFDFISSQSTMHRLRQFEIKNQFNQHVDKRIIDVVIELQNKYNNSKKEEDLLNLLYSNPSGFKLTAGVTTNYRQLKTIYKQRKNHRLEEWQEFCEWVEKLPSFKRLILIENEA